MWPNGCSVVKVYQLQRLRSTGSINAATLGEKCPIVDAFSKSNDVDWFCVLELLNCIYITAI